jgi:hypothetical protein
MSGCKPPPGTVASKNLLNDFFFLANIILAQAPGGGVRAEESRDRTERRNATMWLLRVEDEDGDGSAMICLSIA